MRPAMTKQLGKAASALLRTTFDDSDYRVETDCNGLIGGAQARAYDRVAQIYGFRNRHHLIAAIARRTSDRWVTFHIPMA
jgi:hypothetical protein